MTRFRPAPPIEQPLAALDGPAYDADLTKRATKWADDLKAKSPGGRQSIALDYYTKVFNDAGVVEMSRALDEPYRYDGHTGFAYIGHPTERQQRKAEADANRNVHAVVVRQLKIYLRAQDVAAIWNDPDRMEAERIWNGYLHGASSIAFTKGSKEPEYWRKWRDLIADINGTEDDSDARLLEGRLNRLTDPVKYPVMPDAAYEAAAMIPGAAERAEEIARLDAKYRVPATAGTNGTSKTRVLRKTRPLTAVAR